MKAIVVTDEAAGAAGMTLVKRPELPEAVNELPALVPHEVNQKREGTWGCVSARAIAPGA
jgi:hypothetical protein